MVAGVSSKTLFHLRLPNSLDIHSASAEICATAILLPLLLPGSFDRFAQRRTAGPSAKRVPRCLGGEDGTLPQANIREFASAVSAGTVLRQSSFKKAAGGGGLRVVGGGWWQKGGRGSAPKRSKQGGLGVKVGENKMGIGFYSNGICSSGKEDRFFFGGRGVQRE